MKARFFEISLYSKTKAINIIFFAALLALLFLTSAFVVTSLLWFVNITVSPLTFILSLLISIILVFLFNSRKIDMDFISGIVIFLAVLFFSMIIMGMINDVSFDGNSYHKLVIGHMAYGWNPLVESSYDWSQNQTFLKNATDLSLFLDHYAKASWEIGANFYSLTDNIESAKSYNILSMFALFGMLAYYLNTKGLRSWQCYLISGAAAFNSVTITQFITLYNDGFLMIILFCVILWLVILWDRNRPFPMSTTLIMLFSSIILCINIKFTGLFYAGVFCAAYFVAMTIRYAIERKKPVLKICKLTSFFLVCLVAGVLISGYSTYVMNYIGHGNPLYPLEGEGKIDIITGNEPDSFSRRSALSKLYHSIFSESANIYKTSGVEPKLKIPFTVSPEELTSLQGQDLRIAGYGVLSSGIFILSAIILLLSIICGIKKKQPFAFVVFLNSLIVCLLLILPNTESWWARYSVYLYLVVIMSLIAVLRGWEHHLSVVKIISSTFLILVIFNTTLSGGYSISYIKDKSEAIGFELINMKNMAYTNEKKLDVYVYQYYGLPYTIKDLGIKASYKKERTKKMTESAYDGQIFYAPVVSPSSE